MPEHFRKKGDNGKKVIHAWSIIWSATGFFADSRNKKAVSATMGNGFKKNYIAFWDKCAPDVSFGLTKRDTFFQAKSLQSELTLSLDSPNSTSLQGLCQDKLRKFHEFPLA